MRGETRVLLVDDHPIFRSGLHQILQHQKRWRVVGQAGDGVAAMQSIKDLKPDIVLLDIDMPQMNGLELARALRHQQLSVAVVVLTMYKEEDLCNAALDLGVKGYVLKENAVDDLLKALETVVAGGKFISPSISSFQEQREQRVQSLLIGAPQLERLTDAERRILKLIAADRTSKEIADVLGISIKTVDNHRQNISHKLGLYGSHSLLKFAFDHKSYL